MPKMEDLLKIKTVGALRKSNYKFYTVKEELRKNLIDKLDHKELIFPGIIGYEETVIPELINAVLSQHDFILLGLRGQAKTRILRNLVTLLDAYIPIIRGSEINDHPLNPTSKAAKDLVAEYGEETPVEWIPREQRFNEKLATPDVTIADLFGDIDPIKAANLRIPFAHEGAIHYGIIPRTNRGIFVINELPDLQPRIQVGLLNILEEKDLQIRGFPLRIPLDIMIAFSANPEDYTNRGNIITPLKDRIDSQIITHYPITISDGMAITRQESWQERDKFAPAQVPHILREIIEFIAKEARENELIDQKSGVSARLPIACLENLISNAERRTILYKSDKVRLRISDFQAVIPAITGKIELVYEGEQEGVINVAKVLVGKAIKQVFELYFAMPKARNKIGNDKLNAIIEWFAGEHMVKINLLGTDEDYIASLNTIKPLEPFIQKYFPDNEIKDDFSKAVIKELVLESLHQNAFLSKFESSQEITYKDLVETIFGSIPDGDEDELDQNYFSG
jgi:magnesium chelatase subunit I